MPSAQGAAAGRGRILHGDCLQLLPTLPAASVRLIYIDPPFNTGKRQKRARVKVSVDPDGARGGFGGKRYRTEAIPSASYQDTFEDYIPWLMARIEAALPALADDGSLFVHVDPKESHYVKVALDTVLGRGSFLNEIIWAYDFGGRSKKRWSSKHDTIFWYAKDPKNYVFDFEAMDRIPYMAPGLVGPEKAARGKTPTDVWWHTIVPTNGKEKTGYPTQKPLGVLGRVIRVHSEPGDTVLDFFAGSGTTGEAAAIENRNFVVMDQSQDAIEVMQERLKPWLSDEPR